MQVKQWLLLCRISAAWEPTVLEHNVFRIDEIFVARCEQLWHLNKKDGNEIDVIKCNQLLYNQLSFTPKRQLYPYDNFTLAF